jgi:hypothetical protein
VTAEQGTFTFAGLPCRHPTTVLRWHRMATGAYHLGRYCAACGRWQQWVPQTDTALAAAPPRPRA